MFYLSIIGFGKGVLILWNMETKTGKGAGWFLPFYRGITEQVESADV